MDHSKRAQRSLVVISFVLGATAWNLWPIAPSQAQDPVLGVDAAFVVASEFARGMTQCDSAKVQDVVTPALWGRLSPYVSNQAPGSLGSLEVVQVGQGLNRVGYTNVLFLRRDPDGVEDLVSGTLKVVNGAWRVCGGPGATCPSR